MITRSTRNEDLAAGDVIRMWHSHTVTIVAIEPYRGPLADVIFATARIAGWNGPNGFSLERGGYTEVVCG
jgi:hypothetical protein